MSEENIHHTKTTASPSSSSPSVKQVLPSHVLETTVQPLPNDQELAFDDAKTSNFDDDDEDNSALVEDQRLLDNESENYRDPDDNASQPDDNDYSDGRGSIVPVGPPTRPKPRFPVKVLLLGALESGKSTVFRQVTRMFHHTPDDAWRIRYSNVVVKCIFDAIFSLFSHAEGNSLLLTEEGEVSLKFLSNLVSNGPTFITPEMGKHLKTLWSEPAIQEAFLNSNRFYSIETLPYFMHNIDRIIGNAYGPTWEDFLHGRVKTTGIIDSEFNLGDDWQIRLFDVGGARNERKKWIHMFENVDVVIYLTGLSEYDRVMYEDETTNRMDESIKLFEEICNESRFLEGSAMCLWLTKLDTFAEKIRRSPICDYFPEYEGGADLDAGIAFFTKEHLKQCMIPGRKIHCSVVSVVNQESIENALEETMGFIFSDLQERAKNGTLRDCQTNFMR
eukprot:TRINITY_DN28_c1_g1_i6.p1 TRINITY_DN28_c1_g1~~TRINITY_DN28_c1_g1_i6.p1  ORF type:complete len:446 (-),score=78.48 TRINITY_DN28_c1_g1_i6:984-2321(-)